MDNSNIDLIRSHMDTIILRTLQNSDKYGLEILNEIKTLSEDLYTVKQPTLYSSLKRLESQNLILSYPGEETKGANRTYYRLTDEGRAFLEADQNQWEFARTIIDKLLSDKQFDVTSDKPFEPSDYRPLTKRTKKETEEKVVIKYVEVEKPVYIDRSTGTRLDNYSPDDEDNIEPSESNNFAVYGSENTESEGEIENYIVQDEKLTQIPLDNNNEIENNEIAASELQEIDEINEEYNNYRVSGTQLTEDDYYSDDNFNNYSRSRRTFNYENDYNQYINDSVDYVGLINDVLAEGKKEAVQTNDITPSVLLDDYDGEISMNTLSKSLESKNIKLRTYQKSNTVTYYSGKFYYSNRLLRDWSWITYAVYVVFILLSYLCGKETGIQWSYSLGFAMAGLILPIIATYIWSKSPLRKKRNNVTFNNAMLSAIILLIAFLVLILIIAFFVVQIDTKKPEQYIPAIVVPTCSLVLLPLSVVIYALLFKVKNYHLK